MPMLMYQHLNIVTVHLGELGGEQLLLLHIQRSQLIWFWHLIRMPVGHLPLG